MKEKNNIGKSRAKTHLKLCKWCHESYLGNSTQNFCIPEHAQEFFKMRKKIYKEYQFDAVKTRIEQEKLEQLGKDYVLKDLESEP